jgi:ElaB/YqjD/DUF883 family membrane-anchored ribosome-binding protein
MARGAHSAVDRAAGTATSAVDTATSAVSRVRSGVDDVMSTMGDKMSRLSSSREQWVDNCREGVREHPLATVGVALAAGYVLARWIRS